MATSAEQEAIKKIMKPVQMPCIVELGARGGEDEDWIRGACSEEAHYVMVEPDIRNAQLILDRPQGIHLNRRLIVGAVAGYNGMVQFNGAESTKDGTRTSGSR